MRMIAAALAATMLVACGPSEKDITEAKYMMSLVNVARHGRDAAARICARNGNVYSPQCIEHREMIDQYMAKKGELQAFCNNHMKACEHVRRLEAVTE